MANSIYDFTCQSINEEPVKLEDFKGKTLLIVNTASFCGFTPQYKGLEAIYREFADKGFAVLGFPSNQFGEEPNSNEAINNFCLLNYGVSFPMFSKVKINGDDAEPLFDYLKQEQPGFLGIKRVHWNFTKFLVDKEGNVIKRYPPLAFPSTLRSDIEKLL